MKDCHPPFNADYALTVAVSELSEADRVFMAELCLQGWRFQFACTELDNDDQLRSKFTAHLPDGTPPWVGTLQHIVDSVRTCRSIIGRP